MRLFPECLVIEVYQAVAVASQTTEKLGFLSLLNRPVARWQSDLPMCAHPEAKGLRQGVPFRVEQGFQRTLMTGLG